LPSKWPYKAMSKQIRVKCMGALLSFFLKEKEEAPGW
jgi:hypothetical protein